MKYEQIQKLPVGTVVYVARFSLSDPPCAGSFIVPGVVEVAGYSQTGSKNVYYNYPTSGTRTAAKNQQVFLTEAEARDYLRKHLNEAIKTATRMLSNLKD